MLLANSCNALTQHCIADFEVLKPNIEANLTRSPILVTALHREIGYARAAEIAKRAYQEGRDIMCMGAGDERSGCQGTHGSAQPGKSGLACLLKSVLFIFYRIDLLIH